MRRAPRGGVLSVALALAFLSCGRGAEPPAGAPPVEDGGSAPDLSGGAGSSLVPLARTGVRRLLEEVVLRRGEDRWTVEVLDLFEAGAVGEEVPVGLPEFSAAGESGEAPPTVSEVRLQVDAVERAPGVEPPPSASDLGSPGGIRRLFAWRLPFEAEERRLVRLRYRLEGSRTPEGEELLFYYLNTGTPWAGASGRVNVRVELGGLDPEELIPAWLRPRRFGIGADFVAWRLDEDEPAQDLVLAARPAADPWLGLEDRERGLLALEPQARAERIEGGTPREWRFWLAHLEARRGGVPEDERLRERLADEPWYAPGDGEPPRPYTDEERRLARRLAERLEEWERHRLPSPEEPGR